MPEKRLNSSSFLSKICLPNPKQLGKKHLKNFLLNCSGIFSCVKPDFYLNFAGFFLKNLAKTAEK